MNMNITKGIFRHLIDGINFRHLTDDFNCHVYEQYVMTTNIIKSLAEDKHSIGSLAKGPLKIMTQYE